MKSAIKVYNEWSSEAHKLAVVKVKIGSCIITALVNIQRNQKILKYFSVWSSMYQMFYKVISILLKNIINTIHAKSSIGLINSNHNMQQEMC